MEANGDFVEIQSVSVADTAFVAYNLTVADFHTYFVAAANSGSKTFGRDRKTDSDSLAAVNDNVDTFTAVWVHNSKGCLRFPRFGHTSKHGQDRTQRLMDRARGGQEQGQWIDNKAAARFIDNIHGPFRPNLPNHFPLPPNFPARVITPQGNFVKATRARYIWSGRKGTVSVFPVR